jgi:hypothetical protein
VAANDPISYKALVRMTRLFGLARSLVGCRESIMALADVLHRAWSSPREGRLDRAVMDAPARAVGRLAGEFTDDLGEPRRQLIRGLLEAALARDTGWALDREAIERAFATIEQSAADEPVREILRQGAAKALRQVDNLERWFGRSAASRDPSDADFLRSRAYNASENLDSQLLSGRVTALGVRGQLSVATKAAERSIQSVEGLGLNRRTFDPDPLHAATEVVARIASGSETSLDTEGFRRYDRAVMRQLPETEGREDPVLDVVSAAVLVVHSVLEVAAGREPEFGVFSGARSRACVLASADLGIPRLEMLDPRTGVHPAVCAEVAAQEQDLAAYTAELRVTFPH